MFVPRDQKDIKEVVNILERNGWAVEKRRTGHYSARPPSPGLRITIPGTPGDFRWGMNFIRDMRRHSQCPAEFRREEKEEDMGLLSDTVLVSTLDYSLAIESLPMFGSATLSTTGSTNGQAALRIVQETRATHKFPEYYDITQVDDSLLIAPSHRHSIRRKRKRQQRRNTRQSMQNSSASTRRLRTLCGNSTTRTWLGGHPLT